MPPEPSIFWISQSPSLVPGVNATCTVELSRKLERTSSLADSSESTSFRNEESRPQERSRKAGRSLAGNVSACSSTPLICCHRSGVMVRGPAHLLMKPNLGGCPVAFHGCFRDVEHPRRFLYRDAAEKS